MVRQHKADRMDDVRRRGEEHLALGQRLMHQPEGVVLEVAEAAVDELGRGGGSGAGEVALLAQEHGKAATGGIPRNAAAIDAAADDGDVMVRSEHATPLKHLGRENALTGGEMGSSARECRCDSHGRPRAGGYPTVLNRWLRALLFPRPLWYIELPGQRGKYLVNLSLAGRDEFGPLGVVFVCARPR